MYIPKIFISLTLLLGIITSTAQTQASESFKNSDTAAIETVIFNYFEGNGTADRERLSLAFDEKLASMGGVVKNDKGIDERKAWRDMSAVLDRWAANKEPKGAGRDGEILSIQVVDGRIATALFKYTDQYIDAFTLIKFDRKWKIASKTFIEQ